MARLHPTGHVVVTCAWLFDVQWINQKVNLELLCNILGPLRFTFIASFYFSSNQKPDIIVTVIHSEPKEPVLVRNAEEEKEEEEEVEDEVSCNISHRTKLVSSPSTNPMC